MDPNALRTVVNQIVELGAMGALPKHDFSVAELEGRIAGNFNNDVTCRQVVAALGYLKVRRKSPRDWDHDSLDEAYKTASEDPLNDGG